MKLHYSFFYPSFCLDYGHIMSTDCSRNYTGKDGLWKSGPRMLAGSVWDRFSLPLLMPLLPSPLLPS